MHKKIDTLEQLEVEKEKLKMKIAITKDALSKSVGTNRKNLKDFMITKVAMPTGIIGLGALAIKQLAGHDEPEAEVKEKNRSFFGLNLKALLPIGMNLLQTYLLEKQNAQVENQLHQMEEVTPTNPS